MFCGLNHSVKESISFQSIYNFDNLENVTKAVNFQIFNFKSCGTSLISFWEINLTFFTELYVSVFSLFLI